MEFDIISPKIIGCAIEVHRLLGPGLLESVYEECLVHELKENGFKVERQKPIPVFYKKIKLDCGFRLDLLVEDAVIIELKSVDQLMPVHQAQILTYLKFSKVKIGLLINFNVPVLKSGLKRYIL